MDYRPDATDLKILDLLQSDAKLKIKEIAHQLQLTTSPVFERIRRLEKAGFIKGYITQIDFEKMGFNLVAFCSVTLESHHKAYITTFEEQVRELPEVMECYHIAGMFDYLLKVYARDMADYQRFITQKLASLANISRVQSSFVMTNIKHTHVLPR